MENISKREQWKIWSYVAAHSFGGPAGQIAVIHKVLVVDKKLVSEEQFLHALNFCMLLPGPEAQQLATYLGWLINKWRGGLLAGGLFILPGFLSVLVLSLLYVLYQDVLLIQGLFYGMKPAIIAIVAAALLRISQKSLKDGFQWALALSSFVAIFLFNVPFPFIVFTAAFLGWAFRQKGDEAVSKHVDFPPIALAAKTLVLWSSIWLIPIVFVLFVFGEESTFHMINIFFSKMAMVTFGGAYAVLSYVAQQAVEVYGWLRPGEMLDGIAMAETTPGPLIQTVQFVGFLAAYRFPDMSSPIVSAIVGSILTTWVTYAPCFLWIFTLAPYIEYIRGRRVFTEALQAITAAVVGVILNLSVWFALKALFKSSVAVKISIFDFEYPVLTSIDWYASGICLVALFLQFYFKKSMFFILGTSATLGVIAFLPKP